MARACPAGTFVEWGGPLLGILWSSPLSLLGLLLAPLFPRRSLRGRVLLCEDGAWMRRVGFRYRAMTLGHVVVCVDRIDDAVFGHELVHVHQADVWGPLYPIAYGLASLWALARGRHYYRDNYFEIQARRLSGSR